MLQINFELLLRMIKEFVKSLDDEGIERLRVRLTIKKGKLTDVVFQYESLIEKKWTAIVRCNVHPIGNCSKCPERVLGTGSGNSAAEAVANAQKDANAKVPRGCQKKHCHVISLTKN